MLGVREEAKNKYTTRSNLWGWAGKMERRYVRNLHPKKNPIHYCDMTYIANYGPVHSCTRNNPARARTGIRHGIEREWPKKKQKKKRADGVIQVGNRGKEHLSFWDCHTQATKRPNLQPIRPLIKLHVVEELAWLRKLHFLRVCIILSPKRTCDARRARREEVKIN